MNSACCSGMESLVTIPKHTAATHNLQQRWQLVKILFYLFSECGQEKEIILFCWYSNYTESFNIFLQLNKIKNIYQIKYQEYNSPQRRKLFDKLKHMLNIYIIKSFFLDYRK